MKEQKAPVIRSGRAPSVIFNEFKLSDSLVDSVEAFNELKAACGIAPELQGKKRNSKNQLFIFFNFPPPPKLGLEVYQKIKSKVGNISADTFWKLLDMRMAQVEYRTAFKAKPPRAGIVGSGPGGLRTAIEVTLSETNISKNVSLIFSHSLHSLGWRWW